MRDGLKIIQLSGGYYGYAVTKIAYVRRIAGDEYEILPGARILAYQGNLGEGRKLEGLAADGPKNDYKMFPPSKLPEEINRLLVRRSLPADEAVWAKHIEKPAAKGEV